MGRFEVNWTPEAINLYPLIQPRRCGFCVSSHIANSVCICEEDCGVGWCASPTLFEGEPWVL